MLTRVLTGVIAFVVFLPFLVHSDTIAYPIAMALCSVISTYEMIRCVGLHKKQRISVPLCLAAAALPICVRLLHGMYDVVLVGVAACLILVLYMLAITVFSRGSINITQSMTSLIVGLYIMAAFSGMVFLRDFDEAGAYIYLLVFIGAWVPDTFAYFTGRLFGKHKLIPDVSPKKTVEGAIGGALFCVLAFVGFGFLYNNFWLVEGHDALPIWLMAVAGLLSALVSMIGDLSMSVIKRHYGIKDFGRLLPGHGGFLDRFDSVLAVSVILAVAFGIADYVGVL